VIVLDASAALAGLLNDGPARQMLRDVQVHAPHLIDTEIVSGLRGLVIGRRVSEKLGRSCLDVWRQLAVTRYPAHGLLERVWQLRDNVTAYDAVYVALAEQLDCPLVTADARIAAVSRIGCPVTLVPR
jgi:predicted nucleic acid-binding protein